jgi:prepilin-type N-terminal cleavage/methylation domain-containing protein
LVALVFCPQENLDAMKKQLPQVRAFTLIELLVVIAIIAVLAGLGQAAYSSAVNKALTAAEVSAARTLTSAYQAAAADSGGRFMLAYDSEAKKVPNGRGGNVMSHAGAGYPWRLAPYFNYAIEDTLLVSGNKQQIQETMSFAPGSTMFDYALSRFPSLGINRFFVGGQNSPAGSEAVRTTAQASQSIIVFVSAGTPEISGYEYVRAPGGNWASATWADGADPGNFGHVDPRHGGKAVVAFLEGSTRLMTIDELKDMRLWSMRAAKANDPNYSPGK